MSSLRQVIVTFTFLYEFDMKNKKYSRSKLEFKHTVSSTSMCEKIKWCENNFPFI